MHYPVPLLKLIDVLKRLPGVGHKSAERFAFHLLTWPEDRLRQFVDIVGGIKTSLKNCLLCGCLTDKDDCPFCDRTRRDETLLCIIASPRDAFIVEETHQFKGLYHVIGGLLSPIDNRGPDLLSVKNSRNVLLPFRFKKSSWLWIRHWKEMQRPSILRTSWPTYPFDFPAPLSVFR